MKKIIIYSLVALPLIVNAQKQKVQPKQNTKPVVKKEVKAPEAGVNFIHKVSNWNDIVAKAQKENKFIFLDCFTTWCGPCKYVSKNIFPLKNVGSFYNENFVNVKLQIDETKGDNADVIASRKVAKEIETKYDIAAYPTFLIFDKTGKLVHKFVGAGDENFMIEKAKNGLSEKTQIYALLDKYNKGEKSESLLINILKACGDAGEKAEPFLKDLVSNSPNIYTKENGSLILANTENSSSIGFETLYNAREKWNQVLDKNELENTLKHAIENEILSEIEKQEINKIDWENVKKTIENKYPDLGEECILKAQIVVGMNIQNWDTFQEKMLLSVSKYPNMFDVSEYNELAWTIFENIDNKDLLNKALEWSKIVVEKNPKNAALIDTYANLLYKLGNKKEAMEMETKAVSFLKDEKEINAYKATIEKMKKGTKTWK